MGSKHYFDRVAGQWDRMRRGFFPESVRQTAFKVAGIESGKMAADIGAGTGFVSEGLIQNGLKVVAVDQSKRMLQELKSKFSAIDCRPGRAEHLPLEEGSMDYVFANMYLHHVEQPQVAIEEMARILKPDGSLVITDLDTHHFEFLKKEHHDRWMGFDRDQVANWFRRAGLKAVRVDSVGQNCCARSVEGAIDAAASIFVASGRK